MELSPAAAVALFQRLPSARTIHNQLKKQCSHCQRTVACLFWLLLLYSTALWRSLCACLASEPGLGCATVWVSGCEQALLQWVLADDDLCRTSVTRRRGRCKGRCKGSCFTDYRSCICDALSLYQHSKLSVTCHRWRSCVVEVRESVTSTWKYFMCVLPFAAGQPTVVRALQCIHYCALSLYRLLHMRIKRQFKA